MSCCFPRLLHQALVRKRVVFPCPSKDYDDSYILRYALRWAPGACVVSNDRFRDWEAAFPKHVQHVAREWVATHVISFTFVGRAASSSTGVLE